MENSGLSGKKQRRLLGAVALGQTFELPEVPPTVEAERLESGITGATFVTLLL